MKVQIKAAPGFELRLASDGAAGYDLRAYQGGIVSGGGQQKFETGVAMALPMGYFAQIAPRSGLALNHWVEAVVGVIDSDYRGVIGVILKNRGMVPFEVKTGDRIAQLIFKKVEYPIFEAVEELPPTRRGGKGWGSTGKH